MRFLFKVFLLFLYFTPFAQVQPKAIALARFLEKSHYAPRQLNDAFGEAVFRKMLYEMDPFRIYFDADAVQSLASYQSTIDDELNGKPGNFCKTLASSYYKCLLAGEALAKELLKTPITRTQDPFFQYYKLTPYAKDQATYKIRWQQYLRWRIMARVYEKWEYTAEDSTGAMLPAATSAWFKDEEASARNQISKRVEQRLKEHNTGGLAEIETLVNKLYLHTIAQCFDPHSDYFDSGNKKEFSESLSADVLEYGFSLEETEEGEIIIDELKPGGAAWNTGNIYADDKLLQVKTKSGKTVNVKDEGYEAVNNILNEAGQEEIELILRSADGTIRQVKLQKQEAQNEENIVRGYLLNGSKKIGYISLPSFYTNWDEQTGSGCANDLSKEIIKLKREKIDGLILDLRYNGGGSVQEAVEIAGIFIEAGPMSIIRYTSGERSTMKDPSRGSIYDGPLMVLINGQSASASELVAATLQDYKRAIIMGSPTFGKATMQVMLPLDTTIINNRDIDEKKYNPSRKYEDYVKVTMGKIYRVSGETNQLRGVTPDVQLPDAFASLSYTERSLDYALAADTITQSVAFSPLPVTYGGVKLKALQNDVVQDAYFAGLEKWVAEMKAKVEEKKIPLQWEAFADYEKSSMPPLHDDVTAGKFTDSLKTENTSYTRRLLELENPYQKEINQWLLEDLETDPYIRAAFFVLSRIL
jgi:carboxyl-terminal processing protease